ncbi:MAG: alpha/beta hydrolase [Verrucomicrobiota bacterium]
MIFFATNRNLLMEGDAFSGFGDEFNYSDPTCEARSQIRVGWINSENEPVILDESDSSYSLERNPPSRRLFNHYRASQRQEGGTRNVLFYIHGYNSDFQKTVEAAQQLEELYNVDVLLFSWPSRGDGPDENPDFLEKAYGVVGYKRDKRRAKDSADELLRVFKKMATYFAEVRDERCNQKLSLLAFSMGNYVLKKAVGPSSFEGETSFFDNIILSAPDVNMYDHVNWMHKLKPRGHTFVLFNERDMPLNVSQKKGGIEQEARLGCNIPFETLRGTFYLDLTKCFDIGRLHGYVFKRDWCESAPSGNSPIDDIFAPILNGARPSDSIPGFRSDRCLYTIREEV